VRFHPRYRGLALAGLPDSRLGWDCDRAVGLFGAARVMAMGNRLRGKLDRAVRAAMPRACLRSRVNQERFNANVKVRTFLSTRCLLRLHLGAFSDAARYRTSRRALPLYSSQSYIPVSVSDSCRGHQPGGNRPTREGISEWNNCVYGNPNFYIGL